MLDYSLLIVVLVLPAITSCSHDAEPEAESAPEPANTNVSHPGGDPTASDDAYCRLFAARMQECMPHTAEERTLEQEVERCITGRATARTLGQFDDEERAALARCLAIDDCDEVGRCMGGAP